MHIYMQKASKDNVAKFIRSAGLRATETRKLVYAFLKKSKYPVSIKEVIEGVGEKNIDQVTVYRILDAFQKAGVVTKVDFRHGHAHFELKDDRGDHHHIICTGCDRVEDFTGCESDRLASKALKQTTGFAQISSHSLEFFGLCNSCVRQGKTSQAV
jgi:Fe2+ or Zn2+ uptake regulation protein